MTGQPIRSAISSRAALLVSLALAVSVCSGCGSSGGTTGTGGANGTGGAGTGGYTSTGGSHRHRRRHEHRRHHRNRRRLHGRKHRDRRHQHGRQHRHRRLDEHGRNDGTGGVGGKPATGGTTGTGGAGGKPARGGTSWRGGAAAASAGSSGSCPAAISDFQSWPSGKGPADIGAAAVTAFKPHTGDAYSGAGYAWTFAYVASLQFTQLTNDTTNNAYLVSHFDCGQAGPDNSSSATVDTRAFGDLPLEIFVEKGTAACKTLGMARADAQWSGTADTAITKDARYWSDDMFMITGLQDFGYRATKTEKYLDRTALTMVAYLTALQQSDGLMWHTKQTMAKWGRANGWFAAGMALLLQDLPSSNTNRATIMAGYKKMMDGLVPVQIASGTDAGAWRQVLDRTDAGAEMSCTAMFTYALVTGLKNGWISGAQYVTAAKNGWTALGNKTSSGQLSQVCPGTGQAYGSSGVGTDLKSQQDFYINLQSSFAAGDQHGQAALMWAAIALLRTDCPGAHRPSRDLDGRDPIASRGADR